MRILAFVFLCSFLSALGAKVPAEEAARLGQELTPIGAQRAGEGAIPEWTGGIPQHERTADNLYVHPFPDDKPEFVIDAKNMGQYAEHLMLGTATLLKRYPETYRLPVYQTRRTAFFPEEIYAATRKNAETATLSGTDAVKDASLGFPFPIPGSAAEVIWNHKMKYRGPTARRYNNQAIVLADGSFTISKLVEEVMFAYANIAAPGQASDNLLLMYRSRVIQPPKDAGQLILVHENTDAEMGGRRAWIYNPGVRRVRRVPDAGYDNPSTGTDGNQTNDQIDMFNGSLARYDWQLVGKKSVYIPYNSYNINDMSLKYTDIIGKGHINQELTRYELHRVWVIDATLRDNVRHQFGRRTFYVDEDSWTIVGVDCYDARGQLWKFQEGHLVIAYDVGTIGGVPELIYDFQSGRYFATAMVNEDKPNDFGVEFDEQYFSPQALKKSAIR